MTIDSTALINQVQELEKENELIMHQLQEVSEELEHQHLRNQKLEKTMATAAKNEKIAAPGQNIVWVDDELPALLAENARLQTLLNAQREQFQLESNNTLAARLGSTLINLADQGKKLSIPSKLLAIWRQSSKTVPPAVLGGKNFDKLIALYQKDGLEAVEALLKSASVSQTIEANAYTALARQLPKEEAQLKAELAQRANTIDPKPFRLKWLAFRLHDAGRAQEAEALLHLLPGDVAVSDSEKRQIALLTSDSKRERLNEAKQQSQFNKRRADVEYRMASLARERDEQAQRSTERGAQNQKLKQEIKNLQQSYAELESEYKDIARRADWRNKEIKRFESEQAKLSETVKTERNAKEKLQQAFSKLEAAHKDLKKHADWRNQQIDRLEAELTQVVDENKSVLEQLFKVQEELERYYNLSKTAEQEKSKLTETVKTEQNAKNKLQQAFAKLEAEHKDLKKRADWRNKEIKRLEADQAKLAETLKTEKSTKNKLQQAFSKLESERAQAVDENKSVLEQLFKVQEELERYYNLSKTAEQEKQTLADTLSAEQASKNELKEKLQTLTSEHAELNKKADWRTQEINRLKQELDKHTQENDLLVGKIHKLQKQTENQYLEQQKLQGERQILTEREQQTAEEANRFKEESEQFKQANNELQAANLALDKHVAQLSQSIDEL